MVHKYLLTSTKVQILTSRSVVARLDGSTKVLAYWYKVQILKSRAVVARLDVQGVSKRESRGDKEKADEKQV